MVAKECSPRNRSQGIGAKKHVPKNSIFAKEIVKKEKGSRGLRYW